MKRISHLLSFVLCFLFSFRWSSRWNPNFEEYESDLYLSFARLINSTVCSKGAREKMLLSFSIFLCEINHVKQKEVRAIFEDVLAPIFIGDRKPCGCSNYACLGTRAQSCSRTYLFRVRVRRFNCTIRSRRRFSDTPVLQRPHTVLYLIRTVHN